MTVIEQRIESGTALRLAVRICDVVSAAVLGYGLVLFLLGGGLSKFPESKTSQSQGRLVEVFGTVARKLGN
jgi:hypothetical protein